MKAIVNGEVRELPDDLTVGELLDSVGAMRRAVAVARNERVVPRSRFDTDRLTEGDRVEIIRAVAGG